MIEIFTESTETCIGFKISGQVSPGDYGILLPRMEKAIKSHGYINLLVVMGDFEGWQEFDSADVDFKPDFFVYNRVEKLAFVGEKKWQEWMVKILNFITLWTEERFFPLDQLENAWEWVLE